MSHCVIIALLPPNTTEKQMEKKLGKLMAPYDEALEVAPYQRKCWCVNRVASNAACQHTNGMVEEARVKYNLETQRMMAKYGATTEPNSLLGQGDERHIQDSEKLWKMLIAPIEKERDKFEKAHPDYNKANPSCSECHGTGTYETTYNPEGWWDWYTIGGRWSGYLPTGKDICSVEELLEHKSKDWIPYAMLTPDGKWHQKGEMLSFGYSDDKMTDEEWGTEVLKLVNAHPKHLVVVVDCHT